MLGQTKVLCIRQAVLPVFMVGLQATCAIPKERRFLVANASAVTVLSPPREVERSQRRVGVHILAYILKVILQTAYL